MFYENKKKYVKTRMKTSIRYAREKVRERREREREREYYKKR